MKSLKDYFLIAAVISYITVIGGAVYEHLCVVPRWSSAPPESLSMFQGKYGLNPGAFWMPIHPITMFLLIITATLHWNTPRKPFILYPLFGYLLILITTFIYFVPELMAITKTQFAQSIDLDLQTRASTWETLSLVRLLLMTGLAIVLLRALNIHMPERENLNELKTII